MKANILMRTGIAIAAAAAGTVLAAPAAYAASETPCDGRSDLVSVTDEVHTRCFANAGNVGVYMYGVGVICSGNNKIYAYNDGPAIVLEKWECVFPYRINVYTIHIV